MQNETFGGPEQISHLPIRAPQVQREAMWLYAERETGQKLDRDNPDHKELMLSLWLKPEDDNAARFYGDYVDSHDGTIDPNDKEAIFGILEKMKEGTVH